MQSHRFILFKIRFTVLFLAISVIALSQPRAVPAPYGSTLNYNYVRVWNAAIPQTDPNALIVRPVGEVMQSTQFLDGLGRPFQSVAKQMSPQLNDLVSAIEYDEFGREKFTYLPFVSTQSSGGNEITNDGNFKLNPFKQQEKFMQNQYGSQGESWFYSQKQYDGSPLNRVTEVYAPGNSWVGSQGNTSHKSIKMDYAAYDALENVRIWNIDYINSSLPTTSSAYSSHQLYKSITTDDADKQVIEYKNTDGQLILKKVQADVNPSGQHLGWLCTYYVYNDMNQLSFTIPAKAIEYLDNNNWVLNQNILDELCYQYRYDMKGRLVEKKVPGAGWQFSVYDQRDRLVFTQDANLALKNQWLASIFDELNRPVITGILDYNLGRVSLQSAVDNPPTSPNNIPVSGFAPGSINSDLSISLRDPLLPSTYQYQASNSITFEPGFISQSGDAFVAEIVGAANGAGFSSNLFVTLNPIPLGYNFTPLTTTYYDNYSWIANHPYTASYNNQLSNIGTNLYAETLPSVADQQKVPTYGMITGSRVRVIEDPNNLALGKWLTNVVYYDSKGNAIQTQSENYKAGTDIAVNRFDFTGKPVVSFVSHSAYSNTFTVVSRQEFDKAGRLLRLSKSFNNTIDKFLAEYSYNESGQLKTKRLAPGYTGSGKSEMETQLFEYNIQGSLIGINKDYALSTGNYNQWNNYFGMYLGYDNKDGVFTSALYNGNITGVLWKSQGDNSPRKYDFTYDYVDRFQSALFKQKSKPADAWSSADMDFSVYTTYEDGNGNLKSLKQMGVVPAAGIVIADDLKYFYKDVPGVNGLIGNQLKRIDDQGTMGINNGLLSDFKDGSNAAGSDDYTYDANGNMVKDLNKNIVEGNNNGITYSYLDKPVKIVLQNKSIVEYTYDATGQKIAKKVTNTLTHSSKTTFYAGDFIYEDNVLQYVLHEEGRLKIIAPVSDATRELNAGTTGIDWPGGKKGVFEYFIKDHLSNTRVVLTEEVQKEFYHATMERNAATAEEPLFGKVNADGSIPSDNELKATRYLNGGTGTPWPNNTTDFVKLTATQSTRIGPNMILKVMAGDIINTKANYFYYQNSSTGGSNNPVADVLQSLIGTLPGANASDLAKASGSQIQSSLNNSLPFNTLINNQPNNGNTTAPKAFLNVVFLDEQFKFIEQDATTPDVGTAFTRVSSANNANASFPLMQQKAPRNGYVFVYLSNQSNETVYYDEFFVTQEHSRISEERSYYPHGLKIAAISSKAFNKLDNRYGYQGDFSEQESETGWNEFDLRNYDPQIGRWTGADPYDEFASPYVGMGNDPVNNVDPSGGGVDLPEFIVRPSVAAIGNNISSQILNNAVLALAAPLDFFRNAKGEVQHLNTSDHTVVEGGQVWTNAGTAYSDEYGTFFQEGNSVRYIAREAGSTGRGIVGGASSNAVSSVLISHIFALKYAMDWDKGLIPKPFYLQNAKFFPGNGYRLKPDPITGGYYWGFDDESIQSPAVDPIDIGVGLAYGTVMAFGKIAAKGGSNIALGVTEHLDDFAKSVNGSTWKTWGAQDFQSQFSSTINNPLNKIHFNMTGPSGSMINPWKAVTEGAKGLGTSRATSWELFQLYSNPGALQRSTFYFNGKIIPAPF